MALSVEGIRNRIEAFLLREGQFRYQHGSGLLPDIPIAHLHASFPELSRPETFLSIREAAELRSTDEGEGRRLKALLEFLADEVGDAKTAPHADAAAALELREEISLEQERLAFRSGFLQLPFEASRSRRDQLAKSLGQWLWENQQPYACRLEAAIHTSRDLGFSSYPALREAVSGFSPSALAEACRAALSETQDAYRDVLAYMLKKIEPSLRPAPHGDAAFHDLQYARTAPWMAEHFPKEDLMSAIPRCLGEMGLAPHARGRVVIDAEERPAKSARAFTAKLQVPDDIRLVVKPRRGFQAFSELFHEFGRAQLAANTSRSAPLEDRRLGDRSIEQGYARVFDQLLLDEAWHRRYLRMAKAVASEAARIAAFDSLASVRTSCAHLLYELELYERGPARPLAEEYESRLGEALFVRVERGFYLRDVAPRMESMPLLRGWALEARLHSVLLDRFNEDYWRNPATGRWLTELFARGQRDDADALARELAKQPLSLTDAGRRLVKALNS